MRGVSVVLAAAFFISLTNVLAPIVYESGSNALTYQALRFLFFVAICRLWLWARGLSPALPPRRRFTAYGAGAAYALGAGSLLASLAYIPVSMAVLILYFYPLLTMIATCALDRRPPKAIEVLCLLAAFMGLALALGATFDNLHPTGLGLAALSSFGIATFVVWSGRSLADLDSTITTFHMATSALILTSAATLASGSFTLEISSAFGWLILGAAVLCFTVAFFAIFSGVRLVGPVRFAMLMNTEPVITIALSIVILSESLTAWQFTGAALVISAVYAAQRFGGVVEGT